MKIAKIDLADRTLEQVFESITPEKIACCNWAEEYPCSPNVTFRLFHTGEKLYLRFDVEEQYTLARVTEDNGEVWTDSCCEIFLSLDGEAYYNVETNCIGKMLIGYHAKEQAVVYADDSILSQVERHTTLGTEPFDELIGDNKWSLMLGLPTAIMHQHKVESWEGLQLKVNLYKCCETLSKEHFLSWQPIDLPKPYFHCPEFFTTIELE